MRISDWSSDVCSSDLLHHACNQLFGFFSAPIHRTDHPDHFLTVRIIKHRRRQHAGGIMETELVLGIYIGLQGRKFARSEEHTSELQSLMRISYAVFCLKKKKSITYKKHEEKMHVS